MMDRAVLFVATALVVLGALAGAHAAPSPDATAAESPPDAGVEVPSSVESESSVDVQSTTATPADAERRRSTSGDRVGWQVNGSPSSPLEFPRDETRSNTVEAIGDVGISLAGGGEQIDARYHQHLTDERLERASDDAERHAVLLEETARLEERITRIAASERQALRSYHAGEIGERTLVNRFALIHRSASAHEQSLAHLDDLASETPGVDVDEELGTLSGETETLQGPIRRRAIETSEPGLGVIHVTAGDSGVLLATASDGRYVREAYRADRYDPGGEGSIGVGDAERAVRDQYAWLDSIPEEKKSWSLEEPQPRIGVGGDIYRVSVVHSYGDLVAYLDKSSGDVFREHQSLELSSVPTSGQVVALSDGLRLVVNRTYETGPAEVRLVDAETGDPVSGQVTVNGQFVGRTDADGVVWFVQGPDETEVTATVGVNTVSITLGASESEGDAADALPAPVRAP